MKRLKIQGFFCLTMFLFLVHLGMSAAPASAGALRITMTDGTSVDVPYFWEFRDELKFDIAGGVAGVPKSQVASVQEILEAKEFDPEVLFQPPSDGANLDQKRMLQEFVESKAPQAKCERKDPEENIRLLKAAGGARKEIKGSGELVHAQRYNVEKNFSTMCVEPEGTVLVMQDILSSKTDLKSREFTLTLFDADGKVLQKKSCELREIEVDPAALKKLEIKGHLYLVKASIKPDQKIKRYEITSVQR